MYGSFFIKDYRIIFYWFPLIITFISAYFINIFDIKKNKFYKNNYLNILFKSSLYYFIAYFLLSTFFYIFDKGFYSIQDNLWIGGSSAFGVASIFFYSLYQLWEKNGFRFFSIQTLVLIFFNILANIHSSRLAVLYILTFTFFVVIRNIQLKKIINSICIFLIVISSYTISYNGIQFLHNNLASIKPGSNGPYNFMPSNNIGKLFEKNKSLKQKILKTGLVQNDGRLEETKKGINTFNNYSFKNKLIGTGWYSSRITIKYNKEAIRKRNFDSEDKTGYSLQAIVSLLLDTGILGIIFHTLLYLLNIYSILRFNYNFIGKLFFISILGINFFCLFIGYPLVNIAYILFLLPNGLINIYTNQNSKQNSNSFLFKEINYPSQISRN